MAFERFRTGVALLALTVAAAGPTLAQAPEATIRRTHALSLVGEPKFPADYKHFDWVNPNAPKGGTVRLWQEGSFDSLNTFTIQGEEAVGLGLLFDSLMVTSADEPSTEYCLVCESVSYPADYSSVTFKLRPEARFHDGKPITVEDVIFSLEAQKSANPQTAQYYLHVTGAKKTGDNEVTFSFDTKGNRELPQIVGELTIIPKHWWEAKDTNGNARDIKKSSLEVPLGSGPYRIGTVVPGRTIIYKRAADWWAKDLPVAKGQWNFEEVRYEYFRERTAAFEAFKSGQIDMWPENTAKAWATDYTFPAIQNGAVRKDAFPIQRVAGMQAWVPNMRRAQFQDLRVRRALNLAFNFEAMNEQIMYAQYTRTQSFFDNSELKSKGLPQGRELAILTEVKDQIPAEVFTTEYKNPVGGTDAQMRPNLAEAAKLFTAAGWIVKGRQLVNAKGEPFRIEILLNSPAFERHAGRYIDDLKKLGIEASIRTVDSAQYQRRIRSFDFDMVVGSFGQSISPGNEQRFFWGSASADQEGSRNLAGIKNPAIDKIIDRVIFAKDRADLVAATHALDRVLLWNAYLVPMWHYPYDRLAWWDRFGRPDKLPSQSVSFQRVWWFDAAKGGKAQ